MHAEYVCVYSCTHIHIHTYSAHINVQVLHSMIIRVSILSSVDIKYIHLYMSKYSMYRNPNPTFTCLNAHKCTINTLWYNFVAVAGRVAWKSEIVKDENGWSIDFIGLHCPCLVVGRLCHWPTHSSSPVSLKCQCFGVFSKKPKLSARIILNTVVKIKHSMGDEKSLDRKKANDIFLFSEFLVLSTVFNT